MTATSWGSGRDSGGAPPAAISSPNDGSPSTITSSTPACAAASRATAASGPTVIRMRASVLRSWRGELAAREERAGRRHRAAGAQAAVEDHRELGDVRQVQREHVAAAEPAGGEPGGHALHAAGELAVGDRPSARAVDDRRAAGEAAGVAQHERT